MLLLYIRDCHTHRFLQQTQGFVIVFINFTLQLLNCMRYRVLLVLLLLLPAMAMAQGRKDYKYALSQFMAAYNSNDAGAVRALFSDKSHDGASFTSGKISRLKSELREMRSFTYVRQREDGLVIFRVKYTKYHGKYKDLHPDHTGWVGLRLDQNNKIVRFKMPTYAYPQDSPRYIMNLD